MARAGRRHPVPVRAQHGEHTVRQWIAGEWELAARRWDPPGRLRLTRPGDAFEVWASPGTGDDRAPWYVNLQDPLRRVGAGFRTMDHLLDLLVSSDLRSWEWKDEAEFEFARRAGVFSPSRAAEIRAVGSRSSGPSRPGNRRGIRPGPHGRPRAVPDRRSSRREPWRPGAGPPMTSPASGDPCSRKWDTRRSPTEAPRSSESACASRSCTSSRSACSRAALDGARRRRLVARSRTRRRLVPLFAEGVQGSVGLRTTATLEPEGIGRTHPAGGYGAVPRNRLGRCRPPVLRA